MEAELEAEIVSEVQSEGGGEEGEDGDGTENDALIAAVVGGIVGLGCLIVVVRLFMNKKKQQDWESNTRQEKEKSQ